MRLHHIVLALGLVLGLGQLPVSSASAAETPAAVLVAADGDLSEWETVLTNPLNAARDADGHSISCAFSDDRDCIVTGREHDLARFAWTWSGTDWAFYLERYGNSGGWEWFWIYLDVDDDGLMETGEPLVRLRLNGDGLDNDLELLQYVASAPAVGDPLADVQGYADGHDLPGTDAGPSVVLSSDLGAHADGLRFEGVVSTAFLGVAAGGPMGFHVAASSNNNIPGSLIDNMGGPGGRAGTTAYRGVSVGPSAALSAGPGSSFLAPVTACNEGNVATHLDLSIVSTSGYDVTVWLDSENDGWPDLFLAHDDGGDGNLSRAQDDLPPAGDSNADGLLDTGLLAAGECVHLLLEESYPNNANGAVETLTIVASDGADSGFSDDAVVEIALGHVTLLPPRLARVQDGDQAWLPHVVTNNTPTSERVDFQVQSSRGWSASFWLDPNADGEPGDAIPLTDTDGSGLPDLVLPSQTSLAVLLSVQVPPGTADGQADALQSRALIGGNARATVDDRVEVVPPVEVSPDHLLIEGRERYGAAGGSVYFPHVLRNGRGVTDTFRLSAVSDAGWSTTILSDPNLDGRPFDARPLVPAELTVPGGGEQVGFLVRVDVPSGSATGTASQVTVSAVSQGAPAVADSATDDAVAAIVRTYEDASHVVNTRQFTPCTTVFALASGLPPSTGGFRFTWRDDTGTLIQAVAAATDAQGRTSSSHELQDGEGNPSWSVDIDAWDADSNVWLTQDSAVFAAVSALRGENLVTGRDVYHVAGADLAGSVDLFNDAEADAFDLQLRWVVRSPDGASYLRANGVWAAYTGVEATALDVLNRLNAGSSKPRGFGLARVDFPAPGTYSLELFVSGECGGEALAAASDFVVVDDLDGDGLSFLEESAAGTDPADADSDDDGLVDGLDGVEDSDGDGVIDALDCDSDDDGLPDGLEAGVWDPHDDTDTGSGCWRVDLWPGSTTDPDLADTDGGGVPDGAEDRDGNGRLDAGEGDPRDPADDVDVDSDDDGVPDLEEEAEGTDPQDPDSDDDGLSDGAERGLDSDGDGLIDGLECDSDDDGLPDGLEAGLETAPPGTDAGAGCFRADADPSSTTDPRQADSDGGGVSDGAEDLDADGALGPGETDPTSAADDDSDGDGLPNLQEDAAGSSRFDRDSDDDGRLDGEEPLGDSDGDGVADLLDCDSDDDGLPDGLEIGLTVADADTDPAGGCFVADADPATTTDPARADSDGAGVPDGEEDLDRDGRVDPGETDPSRPDDDDSDGDLLPNLQEDVVGSDRFDRDSDDDGLTDGEEPVRDSDGDGAYDATECDSDGDGLPDGLEAGRVDPDPDTDLSAGCWLPDSDPGSTTDPTRADSDGGGVPDGLEDANGNGRRDAGERDPALADDDSCSTDPLPAIRDLRLTRRPSGEVDLRWSAATDACATYTVWSWGEQADRPVLAEDLSMPEASDPGLFRPGDVVFYTVAAVSSVSGVGEQ